MKIAHSSFKATKYRFCCVIFVANCSQYLLNSVICFHASKYKNVDKEFSEKVAKSFYVDDFNSAAKDISEGIEIYKEIKLRFLDASFNVRKCKPITLIFKIVLIKMKISFHQF